MVVVNWTSSPAPTMQSGSASSLPVVPASGPEIVRHSLVSTQWLVLETLDDPHVPHVAADSTTRTQNARRSEEHTSELQSLAYLVCRLLLEKKNNSSIFDISSILHELETLTI